MISNFLVKPLDFYRGIGDKFHTVTEFYNLIVRDLNANLLSIYKTLLEIADSQFYFNAYFHASTGAGSSVEFLKFKIDGNMLVKKMSATVISLPGSGSESVRLTDGVTNFDIVYTLAGPATKETKVDNVFKAGSDLSLLIVRTSGGGPIQMGKINIVVKYNLKGGV